MAARVFQSVVTLFTSTPFAGTNARVYQSVVTLFVIPAPVPPPPSGVAVDNRPMGGGGMIEDPCCPPVPPRPRCVEDTPEVEHMDAVLIQSLRRRRRW